MHHYFNLNVKITSSNTEVYTEAVEVHYNLYLHNVSLATIISVHFQCEQHVAIKVNVLQLSLVKGEIIKCNNLS